MDGTVLDTIKSINYFLNLALEKFGVEKVSEEECKYFIGSGARLLVERALKSKGIYDGELVDKVLKYYNEQYDGDRHYLTEPYPEIMELIDGLRKRGIKVGIVSNKPDFITRPLSNRFFGDSVDEVFGARDGVPLKPSPEAVFEMAKLFSVSADECVYVGDTGVDMKTGKNFGARLVIGVLWGFRSEDELLENGADITVNNALQILSEVEKLA